MHVQAAQLQTVQSLPQQAAPAKVAASPASDSSFMSELKARLSDPVGAAEQTQEDATAEIERRPAEQKTETQRAAETVADRTTRKKHGSADTEAVDEETVVALRTETAASAFEDELIPAPVSLEVESLAHIRTADADLSEEVVAVSEQDISRRFVASSRADGDEVDERRDEIVPNSVGLETRALDAEDELAQLTQSQQLPVQESALFSPRVALPAEDVASAEAAVHLRSVATVAETKEDVARSQIRKSPFRLEVHDLRSGDATQQDTIVQRLTDRKDFDAAYAGQNERGQMTLELNTQAVTAHGIEQNITSSSAQAAGASSSTFQSMLSAAVQENAPEFVRAGSIVLRDNDHGSIHLVLHPESLGNVKIQLSLSDKVISGQITVHSNEAYQAFKDGIGAIKQAFSESGFDTGSFDLQFAGGNSFAQGGDDSRQQQDPSFRAKLTYGDFVAPALTADGGERGYARTSLYAIDIVA